MIAVLEANHVPMMLFTAIFLIGTNIAAVVLLMRLVRKIG